MALRAPRWKLWRRLCAIVFMALLVMGSNEWCTDYFTGSIAASSVLGVVPLVDPLAAIEFSVATRSVYLPVVIGAGLLVGFAVLAGPVFCGWICPLGLVLDLNHALRRIVRQRVLHTTHENQIKIGVPRGLKYVLLGLFVGLTLMAQIPVFQILSPIGLFVRAVLFGSVLGLTVVGAIMVVEWVWPRLWCRTLCPLGALYSVIGRGGVFRVHINPATAGQILCKKCEVTCPMGVPIMREYTTQGRRAVTHPDCTRCGECTLDCPGGVLRLGIIPFPKAGVSTSTPVRCPGDDHNIQLPVLTHPEPVSS